MSRGVMPKVWFANAISEVKFTSQWGQGIHHQRWLFLTCLLNQTKWAYVTLPSEMSHIDTHFDIYHSSEHTVLKWCKNYQNRFTGLIVITIWSCNHCSISFWETDSFHQTVLSNKWVHVYNAFEWLFFFNLCIKSVFSCAKTDWAIWYCWKPKI